MSCMIRFGLKSKELGPVVEVLCEHRSALSAPVTNHDVVSARAINRQFESYSVRVKPSIRTFSLSLLSGLSTATPYYYIYCIVT